MRIRLLDYVGNLGGGMRFSKELLSALIKSDQDISLELVSYGSVMERYSKMLTEAGIPFRKLEIRPQGHWMNLPRRLFGIPRTGWLMRLLGFGSRWHIMVPEKALSECDIVLIPWLHRHRLPEKLAVPVVGCFHDAILFQFEGLLPARHIAEERESLLGWVANPRLRIVVSSNATISTLGRVFSTEKSRFDLVPVSGEHIPFSAQPVPLKWEWQKDPYLLCPANTFPHKNHEVLFRGFAKWGASYPLVISGEGTLMHPHRAGRPRNLRRLLGALQLEIGKDVIPMGYIGNDDYFSLLSHCRALIMPTKAEGGGSFPVFEAMNMGVPVICSDIPVLREQMQRTGGEVIWFEVENSDGLASALQELDANYALYRERAMRQRESLNLRSWSEVAKEYRGIFAVACKENDLNISLTLRA